MIGFLYRVFGYYRRFKGKEDPKRFCERLGWSTQARPKGNVVWFHGASVGELLSLITFLETYKRIHPNHAILLTTATKTSAHIATSKLGHLCIHQYLPYDAPSFIKRFLAHWRPQHCFIIESEIWPFLLWQTKKVCPVTLINARLSEKSYARWKKRVWVARRIFGLFDRVWAPSLRTQERFIALGAKEVHCMPPLKMFADPLPYAQEDLERLYNRRPKWLAVSTHDPEEELVVSVHQKSGIDNLQTWIAPRHIDRIETLEILCRKNNLSVCRYSSYKEDTDVVLIDSIGKLGVFFALCPVVFVGGSFCKRGGHNPLEPLFYGCHTFWGPDMSNFQDITPLLPYDGTCLSEEHLCLALTRSPQTHGHVFCFEDSLEDWVKRITS